MSCVWFADVLAEKLMQLGTYLRTNSKTITQRELGLIISKYRQGQDLPAGNAYRFANETQTNEHLSRKDHSSEGLALS